MGDEDRFRRWMKGVWWWQLAFQPVSQWLVTCLCQWLCGDLRPWSWRASVAASALITEPHNWTLCIASDPPLHQAEWDDRCM